MKKRNKEKNIIRFVFDEMAEQEADSFLSDLCAEDELWDSYEEIDGTVELVKEAEVHPSQASLDNIMAFVAESNPQRVEAEDDTATFLGIKLHKVLTVAMVIFVMVGIGSSVYKIRRSQSLSPDHNNVVQTFPTNDLNSLDWEGSEIDQNLKDIRKRIENLMGEEQL